LLGGEEWIAASPSTQNDTQTKFIGNGWEHPTEVRFSLILSTRQLLPNRYPEDRIVLTDRIIHLRDQKQMKFADIGALLTAEGYVGARGRVLDNPSVFSMYKKRKAHEQRRTTTVTFRMNDLTVYGSNHATPDP
jgi:hypothetical protein